MAKIQKILRNKAKPTQIKNTEVKRAVKIRTKTRFHRAATKKIASKPMTVKSISAEVRKQTKQSLNHYSVLLKPVHSDKVFEQVESRNTIVFQVSPKANKNQIKEAFTKLYKLPVRKVNTLNKIAGGKRAYIRLENDKDAINLASKIGIA